MTVKLIDFTGKGSEDERWRAADMLIFTKNTRLSMDPEGVERVRSMSKTEKVRELEYMASTIPSSWEFVSVTFLINGLTRACAQQMTRTRQASYAMQSQRVADVSEAEVTNPLPEDSPAHDRFEQAAETSLGVYQRLISDEYGCAKQDARGILPMNIQTSLVARYNLRAFVELIMARKSLRVQGEYSDIVHAMEQEVLDQWPWAETFFEPRLSKAIELLEQAVEDVGLSVGTGAGWKIAKAIDLMRKDG